MAGLLLVLGVAGFGMTAVFEREVMRQLDSRLLSASEYLAQLEPSNERLPAVATVRDLVQAVDDQGRVVYSSPRLEGEPALWMPGDQELEPRTVQSAREGELRVSVVRFRGLWVVFAEPLQPVNENVSSLLKVMLFWLPPLLLAFGVLIWVVVGRTLRPVAAAVEHEEQLVADVSHELRSPLAGVRVLLETEPNDLHGVELNRIEALAALRRLEAIADQLLVLTRQGQPSTLGMSRPVDLDEIVLRQVHLLAPRTPVPIDTTDVVAGQVLGRDDDLESMVDNLLTNATRHAREQVRLSLTEESGVVTLVVDDDGPGINRDDRDRVFERFARLDEARSRDRGGAGLGLAIVRATVDAHGGSIEVGDSTTGGASFVVRLPASTPSDRGALGRVERAPETAS
jgi:signal transduction histidine kinase